jgi:hypothetical protein
MSNRQLHASQDGRVCASKPQRINLGSRLSVSDDRIINDGLTNGLELSDGTDFAAHLPDTELGYRLPHDLQLRLPDVSLPVDNEPSVVPAD